MSLRNIYVILSVIWQAALLILTVVAWFAYSHDAGIILFGFAATNLGVSSAVLSLHFRTDGKPRD